MTKKKETKVVDTKTGEITSTVVPSTNKVSDTSISIDDHVSVDEELENELPLLLEFESLIRDFVSNSFGDIPFTAKTILNKLTKMRDNGDTKIFNNQIDKEN